MSALFARRVVVDQAGEKGKGAVSLVDARLTPGELVEIEVRTVAPRKAEGRLLGATRALALDVPADYSTTFEVSV